MMEVKRGKYEPASERTMIEDLSLDEIVLAYLAGRAPPPSSPAADSRPPSDPDLAGPPKQRLEEEEAAYAEVLAAVDRLAAFPLPAEALPELPERLERLNALWQALPRPGRRAASGGASAAGLGRARPGPRAPGRVQRARGPGPERPRLAETRAAPRPPARRWSQALVRYLQRVLPLDGRARPPGHGPRHHPRRADPRGLRPPAGIAGPPARGPAGPARPAGDLSRGGAGDRAARSRPARLRPSRGRGRERAPPTTPPTPRSRTATAAAARRSASGSPPTWRSSPASRPVVDLGCGRGEFLGAPEGARASRPAASRATPSVVRECRERGPRRRRRATCWTSCARGGRGSLGGVFAAQVAEHLPPAGAAGDARARRIAPCGPAGCSCSRP